MRLLATGYKLETGVSKSLIEGFRRCNATQAGSNLLFLIEILLEGLIKYTEINCVCNSNLTDDENKLLDLLSISRHFGIYSDQLIFFHYTVYINLFELYNGSSFRNRE